MSVLAFKVCVSSLVSYRMFKLLCLLFKTIEFALKG